MSMNLAKAILTAASVAGALGAFPPSASAVPLAVINTPGCVTSVTPDSQTCSQQGAGGTTIFSKASLLDLSATANVDVVGPFSYSAAATVTYYMELVSSSGTFGTDLVPLLLTAYGVTEVGGIAAVVPGEFNHNQAQATFSFNSSNVKTACSGFGCSVSVPASFSGDSLIYLSPVSAVYQIHLEAFSNTNSNYPSSFAHAFVDPVIRIDPAFLSANPQLSLAFSGNIPQVPIPAALWMFGSALSSLLVQRRGSGSRTAA